MAQKLYVGNLPFSARGSKGQALPGTRGFAFVEMDQADEAIKHLDNQPFGERRSA